jgi:hypothetical protein
VRFPHTDRPMKARTATLNVVPASVLAAGLLAISLLVILPR